jgi:hypothetical protein
MCSLAAARDQHEASRAANSLKIKRLWSSVIRTVIDMNIARNPKRLFQTGSSNTAVRAIEKVSFRPVITP